MRRHLCMFATVALIVVVAPRDTYGQCCGDCNGDGSVAINELVTAVNNALGECGTRGCGLPATGQRTSYGPPAVGSDGDVRAGVPLSATDNGDGTITDNVTGLMWEKKDDAGGIHDKDNTYTWTIDIPVYTQLNGTVLGLLRALNTPPCLADQCDWRIPNVRELESLVDYELTEPAVRAAFNRNCAPGCTVDGVGAPMCSCTLPFIYWSSTTYQPDPEFAWDVNFRDGKVIVIQKTSEFSLRAVRGGL